MPRKARIDAAGALHHIIVRGIERRKIFWDGANKDKGHMTGGPPKRFVGTFVCIIIGTAILNIKENFVISQKVRRGFPGSFLYERSQTVF